MRVLKGALGWALAWGLLTPPASADTLRQQITLVGIIRVGQDDSRSLVMLKRKDTQKTLFLSCDQEIPGTTLHLLKVTKLGVMVRSEDGRLEELLVDDTSSPELAEQNSWPNFEAPASESSGQSEVITATPQIVWPKTLPMPSTTSETH